MREAPAGRFGTRVSRQAVVNPTEASARLLLDALGDGVGLRVDALSSEVHPRSQRAHGASLVPS